MTEFATDRLARLFICLALFWAHGCAMGGNERERSLGSGLLQMNENNNNLTHFPGKEQVAKLVGLPSWLTGSNAFGQIKERTRFYSYAIFLMGSETSKPTKTLAVNGNTSPGLRRGSSGDAFESAVVTATVISKSNGSTGTVNGNGTIRNAIGLPPAIKVGASISYNENLLSAGIPQQTDSKLTIDTSRSRSGSASSQTSKQRRTIITLKNRQLIQGCFQNPHENLGRRILKRTAERRRDFGRFYVSLSSEQKDDIEETIKTWLKKCVANIEFMDEVQRLAEEFGERFVNFRTLSFKADYFASMADATVAECVLLDNAVHPAHQTLTAFSQFITMVS
ncbi:GLoBin related [Ditylenchus destructor]|uniref:GLoBin related n=1 Tax=Ditylenchus destructor TaxID=166010 RepID=A0AAD4R7X8_9BILA|nr:GLoBin related [Ditylenchus destructor]